VFDSWRAAAAARLEAAGVAPDEARDLAVALVAAVEGGFMLSRAARDPEPMRTVGRVMRAQVEAALAAATRGSAAGGRRAPRR
jgi:hypothetical protein